MAGAACTERKYTERGIFSTCVHCKVDVENQSGIGAVNSCFRNVCTGFQSSAACSKSTVIAAILDGVSTDGDTFTDGFRGIWPLAPWASAVSTSGLRR